jgi:hypothetical protein
MESEREREEKKKQERCRKIFCGTPCVCQERRTEKRDTRGLREKKMGI